MDRTENNTFLLPRIKIKTEASRRAGDTRALEMPGLASVHTVFVREHNQLCDALKTHPDVDSTWGDEDFYQNARRILIAEMQKIVYDEYLPIIMGKKGMRWDGRGRGGGEWGAGWAGGGVGGIGGYGGWDVVSDVKGVWSV